MQPQRQKLSFLGGTGKMGSRLAKIYAKLGHTVIIGSRDPTKAQEEAQKLKKELSDSSNISGASNAEAATQADVVFWCIQGSLPERHSLLKSLVTVLENKIIVDITNVMYFNDEKAWGQISSTEQNAEALGVPARWVSAYKTNFFTSLDSPKDARGIPREVQVCSNDEQALQVVMSLISETGFRPLNCGPLKYTRIIELMGPPFIMQVDRLNPNPEGKMLAAWRFM